MSDPMSRPVSVYLVIESIAFESTNVVEAFYDEDLATARAHDLNRVQWTAEIARLREAAATHARYLGDHPYTEIDEAYFEVCEVADRASGKGTRRAAREVRDAFPEEIRRLHDVRPAIAWLNSEADAMEADFIAWSFSKGNHHVAGIDVADAARSTDAA